MLLRLVCIYMLIFILPQTNADGVEIFNATHLKLNWYFPYSSINDLSNFIIKLNMEDIDSNQTQDNITVAVKPIDDYTEYIEYNEGIRYIINITFQIAKDESPIAIFNITTPIKLDVIITKCNKNELNISLNDTKISKRQTHLCISNNDTTILDINIYPPQTERLVKACNTPNNSINCNESIHLIGLLQLEEQIIPLKFNIKRTYKLIRIESSNATTILIVSIAAFVCLLLITILTIIFYKIRNKKRKMDKPTSAEMIPLNNVKPTFIKNFRSPKIKLITNPFTIDELCSFLNNYNHENDPIAAEYENIQNDYNKFAKQFSKNYNRYNNVRPYEYNRVKLHSKQDYINASYIKNYEGTLNKYIASQGPIKNTINNFWEMIWKQNVEVIIMLTGLVENEKEKCAKYWPNISVTTKYGEITVHHVTTINYVGYLEREFDICKERECRKVKQMHFTSWPDYNVPYNPHTLVNFLRHFRNLEYKPPSVVHCSAGVGRTGTFILSDYLIDQAESNQLIDVPLALKKLRDERTGLVNQLLQYKLVYCSLLEYLIDKLARNVSVDEFKQKHFMYTRNEYCLKDLNHIKEKQYWDVILRKYPHNSYNDNRHKHRYEKEILSCKGFSYLNYYPVEDSSSNYINANKIDNFYEDKIFFATQNPLPSTVGDFWRLIAKENTELIIVLQTVGTNTDIPIFWHSTIINQVDYISLQPISVKEYPSYDYIVIELTEKDESRNLELIYFKNWDCSDEFPDPNDFLKFAQKTSDFAAKNITITCNDGGSVCGVYLTLLKAIEQIETENVIDLCSAVRMLQLYRNDFMTDVEQFVFLYKVIKSYLDLNLTPVSNEPTNNENLFANLLS